MQLSTQLMEIRKMGKNIINGCGIKFDGWHYCGETIHGAERAVYCDKCLSASKSDGEAKFTKGEWHVQNIGDNKLSIDSDSGMTLAIISNDFESGTANARLIASAPEMYEENESRSKLLGKIYVALQQGDASGAFNLLHDSETIDFSSGEPIAVSPALAKARGERND